MSPLRERNAGRTRQIRYADKVSLSLLHLNRACASLSGAYSAADGQHAEIGTRDLLSRSISLRDDLQTLLSVVKAQLAASSQQPGASS